MPWHLQLFTFGKLSPQQPLVQCLAHPKLQGDTVDMHNLCKTAKPRDLQGTDSGRGHRIHRSSAAGDAIRKPGLTPCSPGLAHLGAIPNTSSLLPFQ